MVKGLLPQRPVKNVVHVYYLRSDSVTHLFGFGILFCSVLATVWPRGVVHKITPRICHAVNKNNNKQIIRSKKGEMLVCLNNYCLFFCLSREILIVCAPGGLTPPPPLPLGMRIFIGKRKKRKLIMVHKVIFFGVILFSFSFSFFFFWGGGYHPVEWRSRFSTSFYIMQTHVNIIPTLFDTDLRYWFCWQPLLINVTSFYSCLLTVAPYPVVLQEQRVTPR